MQNMTDFLNNLNSSGAFVGKDTVMNEFIRLATKNISKPLAVEKLDDLLIDEGIAEAAKLAKIKTIKKGMLAKWMDNNGFKRKQIMADGERGWFWVSNAIGKSGINAKIELREYLTNYLKHMDSISYAELTKAMENKGLTVSVWNSHFYHDDGPLEGTPKKWNNWVLTGKSGEKVYQRTENSEQE